MTQTTTNGNAPMSPPHPTGLEPLDNPPVAVTRPHRAASYHTHNCRLVAHSDDEDIRNDLTWDNVEWHELDHCPYCSGEWAKNNQEAPSTYPNDDE